MNLINLFTREEPIAGLEISEDYLRLALLQTSEDKKKRKTDIAILSEEPLPTGTVAEGSIKDQSAFVQTLRNLLGQSSLKVRYVIASLPARDIYSRVFAFPKSVQGQKLEETMKLTIGFQLPVKPEEVYLDWEKIENPEQNEIFLATVPKKTVNSYVEAIELSGLKVVAVEFHPMSFGRIADLAKDEATVVTLKSKSDATVFVMQDLLPRFMRVLPKEHIGQDSIQKEIRKIQDFYESKNGKITKVVDIKETGIAGSLKNHPKLGQESGKWLISLGATLRGLLPRSEDNLVSLMPVGTEEAYEYQKATVFAGFMSSVIVGLSVFFSAAFIGTWLLMTSIERGFIKQFGGLSSLPLPAEAAELEQRAIKFNGLVAAANSIVKTTPRWSLVLDELKTRSVPGIVVTNVSFPSLQGPLTLSGIAQNRTQLNLLKKSLEDSQFLGNVNLPLTNIEQREKISFSISFNIKDAGLITY